MNEDSLSLRELHGSILTAEIDGERRELAGMVCGNYPDCDECGHIDPDIVETDENELQQTTIGSEVGTHE